MPECASSGDQRAAGHAIALAQTAAREGLRRFIAIGGDGTLNEVVNGLLRAGRPRVKPRWRCCPWAVATTGRAPIAFPAASSKRSR